MENKTLILFQGDSVTDANRMREDVQTWNKAHRFGTGYAAVTAGELMYRYPTKGLTFRNKGMAGNRVRDLYARTQEDIINLAPDVLTIMIGVNEVYCKINENCGTVEPDRFETCYRLILEEVKAKLPKTKIIMLQSYVGHAPEMNQGYEAWKALIEPLQAVTDKLAAEYADAYIPLQAEIERLSEIAPLTYWIWDGIHPTQAGHAAISRLLVPAIESVLNLK